MISVFDSVENLGKGENTGNQLFQKGSFSRREKFRLLDQG